MVGFRFLKGDLIEEKPEIELVSQMKRAIDGMLPFHPIKHTNILLKLIQKSLTFWLVPLVL